MRIDFPDDFKPSITHIIFPCSRIKNALGICIAHQQKANRKNGYTFIIHVNKILNGVINIPNQYCV